MESCMEGEGGIGTFAGIVVIAQPLRLEVKDLRSTEKSHKARWRGAANKHHIKMMLRKRGC